MAFSGTQITRLGLIAIPRGLYGSFAGKAEAVPIPDSGIVGGKRRRISAYAFVKFYQRYKKILEDEKAPALPVLAPVAQSATTAQVQAEIVEAKDTRVEIDDLLAKVSADLASTSAKLDALRKTKKITPKISKTQAKVIQLRDKVGVLEEAKRYTDDYIESRQLEETLLIIVAQVLLQ